MIQLRRCSDGLGQGCVRLQVTTRGFSDAHRQDEFLLNFEKHKGRKTNQVDDGYLQWMLKKFPGKQKTTADREQTKQQREAHDLVSELKACSLRRDLQWGKRIHAKAVQSWNRSNTHVVTALIKMYVKCGSIVEARRVFDSTEDPDLLSWNALLLGYAEYGKGSTTLELFSSMKARGCRPNSVTYVAALKACASLAVKEDTSGNSLERGREIHSEIGVYLDPYVQTTLIDMYAKHGCMVDARRVFESIGSLDVVSWNALIMGYAENGEGTSALDLFSRMKASGCAPNSVTYIAALKACASLAVNGDCRQKVDCLRRGREIHSEIGRHMNHYLRNTLIDMYAKCGSMVDARRVFDSIRKPDVVSWTALVSGYAENGEEVVALELFSRMKASGCLPNSVTHVAALKACASLAVTGSGTGKRECLERGREIHSEIGCQLNQYVQSTLIDMYAKCGSMTDARRVFDSIQKPDVVSWSALILGYAENGEGHTALDLFSRMKSRGCVPNSVSYVAALKACASLAAESEKGDPLERGRKIHSEIGCHLTHYVQNTLIDMYANCGSMVHARSVFDNLQMPDVVSWGALLLGYAENGEGQRALDLFSSMKSRGCEPNSVTYVAALKACTSLAANEDCSDKGVYLDRGRKLHSEIGCHLNHYVQNTLIDMYAKCGSMVEARRVFDSLQRPDVISLNLFARMRGQGCLPDSVTYMAALKACISTGDWSRGRKLHSELTEFTAHVVTCLVDFYAKSGSMVEAREVFDLHPRARGVATWNALLAGYASFGESASVFNLFDAMQDKGFRPDAVTFVCVLLCCSHAGLVEKAREYFEAMPVQYGVTPSIKHYTCMVDVLGRANQLNEAIGMLRRMPCTPNAVTWRALLGAAHKWKNVEIGSLAFQSLVDLDKEDGSAYVLMAQIYGSRGMLEEQERVLEARAKSGAWKLLDDFGKLDHV